MEMALPAPLGDPKTANILSGASKSTRVSDNRLRTAMGYLAHSVV